MRPVGILGLGAFLPEKILTNADLEKMVDTTDEWIRTRTGISERHIIEGDIATSDLAAGAARRALEDAGLGASAIDLIIVATVTPDMFFPSTACLVQEKIGATRAAAFDISAACPGFIYAVSIGSQFVAAGTYDHVLVIGGDSLSKITDWTDRSTCVLFGDAAGAAVLGPVRPGRGILSTVLGSDGSGADLLKLPAGGSRMPASFDTVEKRLHYLQMNGNEVYKFAVRIVPEATLAALEKCGLKLEDIDVFIPHQANIRIIEGASKRLKIPEEKVVVNVQRFGNISAASIPVAMEESVREGRIREGDIVAGVAFGAGLTWASCIIRWGR